MQLDWLYGITEFALSTAGLTLGWLAIQSRLAVS